MTTTTATETRTPDLDALERDARERIAECEGVESRLALDALSDEAVAAELKQVQSERASAEAQIRQASLARQELDRRAEQAERERVAAERKVALAEARKAEAALRRAADQVDKGARVFAESLRSYADLDLELGQAMERAGERARRPAGSSFEATLMRALMQARVPAGMLELAGIAPKARPLVESLPEQPLRD